MLSLLFTAGAAAYAFNAPVTVVQQRAAVSPTFRVEQAPQMGATIRELRDRVSSVKNTKKITSAMKLVAAAKVRRAQEAVLRSRPFSETLERILGGLLQRLKTEALDIPLLQQREAKKVCLVSITGDRGLCGAYNANAIKKTEARIKELKAQGVEVELVTIGNKGSTYFKKRVTPVRKAIPCTQAPSAKQATVGVEVELVTIGNKGSTYFKKRVTPVRKAIPCTQAPSAKQATEISSELLSSFYAGDFDRVELVYTTFISMISSVPSIRTIVPLLPGGIEMEGDEIFKMSTKDGQLSIKKEPIKAAAPQEFAPDMIFEQEPSQLLNAILPLYLNGQILRTLPDPVASELASRMSAMQAATDNAKDLQGRLEREMNRARQAKITQELMEIIAGADATGA
eukprot:CAMPEP_0205882246 /NCGR_PEP_ID=MMETSP1083-20121108/16895_1 /ASSEMBLY_ACC=CAM_ASM_000430 /TAXON_ID=97485 /ORGANISM="Prymnesium parvum, Strain Texoma1" /LENGTH=397 /DNA_ID=CAMNT_0053245393 /DNA_START=97 /DNA_END=1291 /DNA_ORIENTATION=+